MILINTLAVSIFSISVPVAVLVAENMQVLVFICQLFVSHLFTENPCLTPAAAAEAAAVLTPSLLNTLVANSAWALVRLAPVAR